MLSINDTRGKAWVNATVVVTYAVQNMIVFTKLQAKVHPS